MQTYKIALNGQNFLLDINYGAKKYGFYTTRIVKALSPSEAERIAVQVIYSDSKLKGSIKNDSSDPPNISVNEIEEILELPDDEMNQHYMFYSEED
jgi:hypothetical protein